MRSGHARRDRRSRLRWAAAGLGAGVAAAALFTITPAQASGATVNAQLSLSGVATQSSVLGGSLVGVHPGDTVDFTASGLPTAGLQNIPALGKLVDGLLSPLLGQFQVVVHTGSNFPGGARSVTVGGPASGPCKGVKDLPVTFPAAGTYDFTWNIQYVLPVLLGCKSSGVSNANLNLLKGVGVALNAANQWVGRIVVANDPPKGGLGLQLPGIKVAPSLPVVGQLPTISVPNISIQGSVTLPGVGGVGGGGNGGGGNGGGGGGSGGGSGGGVDCVPCVVMPQVGNGGNGGGGVVPNANTVTQIGNGIAEPAVVSGPGPVTSTAAAPSSTSPQKQVNLEANKAPAAQMPVLLAIIAIIALSLVTATYARLFLLRRDG